MKTVAIIQARMGSTRLPGKVMQKIAGRPMIEVLLERLRASRTIDQVVVATSDRPENDALCAFLEDRSIATYRGSEDDVLARFHGAALAHSAERIIRITADCPLSDPALIDAVVDLHERSGADYVSNVAPATFPDGLDIEVFTFSALDQAMEQTKDPFDHEHVTPYLRTDRFTQDVLRNARDMSDQRWTVDEPSDLKVVRAIFDHFAPRVDFAWTDVAKLYDTQPELFTDNRSIGRNEGANMGTGQKLWKRAKQIIPGGNMLLSKRSEMHLPEQWPSYFSRTQGCKVWDMDGTEYTDTYLMGVGTNILGYSHPEVDAAVIETVQKGNLSTLNAPEEVWLAEKLIALDPWADMVRFARSGGEANAIAIRIARAASGRDGVAVCGYHGWHDWYLSANLGEDDSLAGHLLPGLDPAGVPKSLRGDVVPFNYNDLEALEAIVATGKIGVIKMEVVRNQEPHDNFLHKVRDLATKNGIVLIFDECTSGFRETFGGLHKKYGVEPDIAVYGKTLGNGYAITAVVGRGDVMQAAQTTFISSTFWTERIGVTAGLKTLEVMEREKSWDYATELGTYVRKLWGELSAQHGLPISISGLPSLTGFAFQSENNLGYKTLITQEMLKKGYLAGTAVYVSKAHTREIFDAYVEQIDPVFALIAQCEDGRDIGQLLEGPISHAGFKRIN